MLTPTILRHPALFGALVLVLTVVITAAAQEATPPPTSTTAPAATTAPATQGTKTPSGLTIIPLHETDGGAKEGDTLYVHFTGMFADGKKFASSIERGEPIEMTLGVGDVLKAWDEGLKGMKVGEKRRVVVPPELAYGKQGQGSLIPPDAELTFDFELVGIRIPPPTVPVPAEPAGETAPSATDPTVQH